MFFPEESPVKDWDGFAQLIERLINLGITPNLIESERWRRGGWLSVTDLDNDVLHERGVGTTKVAIVEDLWEGVEDALDALFDRDSAVEHVLGQVTSMVDNDCVAVRVLDGAIGFGGFSKEWNEALILTAAVRAKLLNDEMVALERSGHCAQHLDILLALAL